MSDSVRPHRRQPTRLPRPWVSAGKNTRVSCHFLLQCMKVKVKSLSRVRLSATPWAAAHQAPSSMGFSRQEYWSGVPLPSPDIYVTMYEIDRGFPGSAVVKKPPASTGDTKDSGSIPGSGESPGEGNGYPYQHSCLENSMDRRAW